MKGLGVGEGATHYAHVFYPLTGLTAEKHDSFLEPISDGDTLAEIRRQDPHPGRARRVQLPSGGLRNTFEARGYTGWDVTSPPTCWRTQRQHPLYPTVFVSMTGEALDHKTPLLRSQQAMASTPNASSSCSATPTRTKSCPFCGPEQEYFLIDRTSSSPARPDQRGAHALRRQAPKGARVRRPLLRGSSGAGAGLHDGHRA